MSFHDKSRHKLYFFLHLFASFCILQIFLNTEFSMQAMKTPITPRFCVNSVVLSGLMLFTSLSWAKAEVILHHAAYLVVNQSGKTLLAARADEPRVPASTTKLVTAWLALKHWGGKHHFMTPFYFDRSMKTLWIKASGDPFLVSDEIRRMAAHIAACGIDEIDTIAIDDSLFETGLQVPGSSLTTNPYDAIPTALAANFNTLALQIQHGKVVSGEPETPLTAFAKTQAGRIQGLKERINTGFDRTGAERHFAQLLAIFLRQQGLKVAETIIWARVPADVPLLYAHYNQRSVADIIRPMMKYSTNFIANQLVLMLAAEKFKRPANFADVQSYMQSTVKRYFNWQGVVLQEGAGLSRQNRLSARQLTELLRDFLPWRELLPEVAPKLYAKSGTLNHISTLAGYIVDRGHWQPFALMMQQQVSHKKRHHIIGQLRQKINTQSH